MQDTYLQQDCDLCGTRFKRSIRHKTPQEREAFNKELAGWVTLEQFTGNPEDLAQKHFCKRLCAIQYLQGLESHAEANTPKLEVVTK